MDGKAFLHALFLGFELGMFLGCMAWMLPRFSKNLEDVGEIAYISPTLFFIALFLNLSGFISGNYLILRFAPIFAILSILIFWQNFREKFFTSFLHIPFLYFLLGFTLVLLMKINLHPLFVSSAMVGFTIVMGSKWFPIIFGQIPKNKTSILPNILQHILHNVFLLGYPYNTILMEISFSLGGIIISFVAGLLSFLSPCVLPLVPAYLGYVSGLNVMEIKSGKGGRRVIAGILAFVLGFSLVFTLMGLTASAVGLFLAQNKKVISVITGILLIIFGLHLVGIMRIPFLDYEKKAHINVRSANLLLSFLMGITFALGWTPCIGPTLSGILALAAISGTVLQGGILLFIYSLGLGIPFILSGILASKVFEFISRVRTLLRYFEIASGILLIALGILVMTGLLAYLSYIFPNWEPPI